MKDPSYDHTLYRNVWFRIFCKQKYRICDPICKLRAKEDVEIVISVSSSRIDLELSKKAVRLGLRARLYRPVDMALARAKRNTAPRAEQVVFMQEIIERAPVNDVAAVEGY